MYRLGLLVFEIFGLKVFGGREEYTLKKFRACICFGRKIDSLPCTSVLSSCCRRSVFEKLEKLEFSCRRRLTRLGPELSIERPAKICPCMPHRHIAFGGGRKRQHPSQSVDILRWQNLSEMLTLSLERFDLFQFFLQGT